MIGNNSIWLFFINILSIKQGGKTNIINCNNNLTKRVNDFDWESFPSPKRKKSKFPWTKFFVGVSPNLYIKTQRILSSHVTTAILFHQL